MFSAENIRSQFPILDQQINGHQLVYFDNGATTQKPLRVIDRISDFYKTSNANIHRGVHTLSRRATEQFEQARAIAAAHFGVANQQQIVFTSGTTDGINIVALGLAKGYLRPGDEVLVATSEHHSNLLPWQLWAQEHQGSIKPIPLLADQSLDYTALERLIGPKTRLIAVAQVSNTLGTIADVAAIIRLARQHQVAVLVDGAQSAPHMDVNLQKLDPDFFVCSAHKIYGPTGVGLIYLSPRWLVELPVARPGGGTIKTVSFDHTEYAEGALRFEPGTPDIAGVIGFAEALRFADELGMDAIFAWESQLVQHAQQALKGMPEVLIYGESNHKAGVISFNVKGQHPFDVGTLLDKYGIAVRTGHHCTQPLMSCLNVPGTVRISFAAYNTLQEVDYFIEKLKKVITMLS